MYKRNIEERSYHHCCCGKALITYYECVCVLVDLVIQRANRTRRIIV